MVTMNVDGVTKLSGPFSIDSEAPGSMRDLLCAFLKDTDLTPTEVRVVVELWTKALRENKDRIEGLSFGNLLRLTGVAYNEVLSRALNRLVEKRILAKVRRPHRHPRYSFTKGRASEYLLRQRSNSKWVRSSLLSMVKTAPSFERRGEIIVSGDRLPAFAWDELEENAAPILDLHSLNGRMVILDFMGRRRVD
jgi:hypothetical protein